MGFLESRCCSKWKLPLCWNRQLKQPTCLSSPSAVADWLFLLQYLCRWSQENRPVQNVGLAPQRVAQKVPPDLKPLATRRGGMKKVQIGRRWRQKTRKPVAWAHSSGLRSAGGISSAHLLIPGSKSASTSQRSCGPVSIPSRPSCLTPSGDSMCPTHPIGDLASAGRAPHDGF